MSGESVVMGRQTIAGTNQSDRLEGGAGDDRLKGRNGDDMLVDSAGADDMNGGGGYDTAFFIGSRSDYFIEKVGRKIHVTRDGETDILTNVEELRFGASVESIVYEAFPVADGGLFDDPAPQPPGGSGGGAQNANQRINGTRGDDVMAGGNGNDSFKGKGGDDLLVDGGGSDKMNGGGGNDSVFFAGSRSDYSVEFVGRKVLVSKDGDTDTLTNIEELLFGTAPDDADIASFLITNSDLIEQIPTPPAPPEPSPPDPAPPPPPTGLDAFEAEVLSLVNEYRAESGLAPLRSDSRLNDAAEDWSLTMANGDFFAHSTTAQVEEYDYDWQAWGENIAAGQTTPESVVDAWIDSPGHRANILSENFQEIGIGYYYLEDDTGSVNYHHYWTQAFGTEFGDMIV
jgi:uncharacterized protein YkwD